MREADEYLALGRSWSSFRFIWRVAWIESGLFLTRLFTRSSFIFDRQEITGYIHERMINVTHYIHT
jgi:hypothetical protein